YARVFVLHHLHALVVVVAGDGQRPLGVLLPDDVLVEHVVDLARLGQRLDVERRRSGELLVDDLVTEIDALVADVDAGAGDQLLDLALALAAEAAEQLLVAVARPRHCLLLPRIRSLGSPAAPAAALAAGARWTMTLTMRPDS